LTQDIEEQGATPSGQPALVASPSSPQAVSTKGFDQAQFTPGPWSAYAQSFPHEVLICTLGPCSNYDSPVVERIAWTAKNIWVAGTDKHESQRARDLANARLIAAAPEMLELLKKAADFIQPFNRGEDLLNEIDAIIAKATGADYASALEALNTENNEMVALSKGGLA